MPKILWLVVLLAIGCGSAKSTPTLAPAPTEDPAITACNAGVEHANLHVHDVEGLDFAIHDCPSVAALKAALARHPGYLDPTMTTPEEFAANRCMYAAAVPLRDAPICVELGARP
jgi:hypothetical protein